MKRTDSGFTAIELMITLVIASILVGLAVPSFRQMMQVNRLAAASNEFNYAFSRARSEALKLGRSVVVCASDNPSAAAPACSKNWQNGWVVFADDNGDGDYSADERLMLVREGLGATYSVTATDNVLNGVVYRPQGIVAGTFGNFLIADSQYEASSRLICISSTGKVRTLKNDKGSDCSCQNSEKCA